MLIRLLWGAGKLGAKYVMVPIAISLATAVVADSLTRRLRARTAAMSMAPPAQTHLDVGIDPTLRPAP